MIGIFTHRITLPEEEIYDILRNARRRRIIEELRSRLGEIMLRDLAESIAETETDQSPAPRDSRQSVYNSLHQTHLPKLDKRGIIEYDSNRKTVRLTEEFRNVDIYMEVVTKYGITWSQYYRTLGIGALIVTLLAVLQAPFFSMVDTVLWVAGFLSLFVLSMAVQLWSRRWLYFRQLLSRCGANGHESP